MRSRPSSPRGRGRSSVEGASLWPGRSLRLLTMRPPLAYGGHAWVPCGEVLCSCVSCHVTIPRWAVAEGYWMTLAGRWCPDLLTALPPGDL